MSLHLALVELFGAEPADIQIPSLDHIACTFTPAKVRALLIAVGGPWLALVERADEHEADRRTRLVGAGAGLMLGKETP